MTFTLNLSPELEQYLLQEASPQGLSVEAVALQLLTTSISVKQKQTEAVNFFSLGSMMEMRSGNVLLLLSGLKIFEHGLQNFLRHT